MISADTLRPPPPLDPTAAAYKDWLHLNVFHHDHGVVGLINTSLHGPPGDARALAVGTALVFDREAGWRGNVAVRSLGEADVGLSHIAIDAVAVAVTHAQGNVHAAAGFPDDGLTVKVDAGAVSSAINIDQALPLGPGWISWYVIPQLEAAGSIDIGDTHYDLAGAAAYHDHNWGRWHWGQDFGWDWGVFMAPLPGPTFVLARVTDRAHEHAGRLHFTVHADGETLRFPSSAVTVRRRMGAPRSLVRLPGAQAALHQGRRRPTLPERVTVRARHNGSRFDLEFQAWEPTQLVTADPVARGYGFIHEIPGSFEYSGHWGDRLMSGTGMAVVEHVE